MNALSYASISPAAAAPLRDPFAALLARLARLAIKLSGRGQASPGALALAQAGAAAYGAALGFVVTQDAEEGATDAAEPSTAELLARLAALRENLRRARQHYGIDERDPGWSRCARVFLGAVDKTPSHPQKARVNSRRLSPKQRPAAGLKRVKTPRRTTGRGSASSRPAAPAGAPRMTSANRASAAASGRRSRRAWKRPTANSPVDGRLSDSPPSRFA